MNTSSARYWVILVLLLAAVYGSFVLWRKAQPPVETTGKLATVRTSVSSSTSAYNAAAQAALDNGPVVPFKLTDQDGKEFDSASLEGKVWVASFFFTNCPAICWRMNQALAAWQHTHPDADVHFVSITCDPDNDTPEALKKYAEHFKADPNRWVFLTGDMKEIQRIGQEAFKVAVVKGDHTDRACVVDKNGQVRGRFRLTEADQAELLDRLLTVVEAEAPAKPASDAPAPELNSADSPATTAKSPDESAEEGADAASDGDAPQELSPAKS